MFSRKSKDRDWLTISVCQGLYQVRLGFRLLTDRACREGSSESSGGSPPGQAVPLTSARCLCSQPLPASRLDWRICPYFHKIQLVPLCESSAALMGQNTLFAPASQAGLCPAQYTNACFLPTTPECLLYRFNKCMLVRHHS